MQTIFLHSFSSSSCQAHLLLPRQPADGREARPLQSPLLDLEQLVGGVQYSETFLFLFSTLTRLSAPCRAAKHSPSLCLLLISLQTLGSLHCTSCGENGSSVDCCVHQGVMNINEDPYPHAGSGDKLGVIHQAADLLVLTPLEIFPLLSFTEHRRLPRETERVSQLQSPPPPLRPPPLAA